MNDEPSAEELLLADALARALDGNLEGAPEAETLAALFAHRRDVTADLARVRRRTLSRPLREKLRVAVPVSLVLAAAAAMMITTRPPEPFAVTMPEPDVALLEAQVRAASERGLRTDLDVEAWRHRRRIFATLKRRYDR